MLSFSNDLKPRDIGTQCRFSTGCWHPEVVIPDSDSACYGHWQQATAASSFWRFPVATPGFPAAGVAQPSKANSHALLRTVIPIRFLVTAIQFVLFSRTLSVTAGLGLRTSGTSGDVIFRSFTVAARGGSSVLAKFGQSAGRNRTLVGRRAGGRRRLACEVTWAAAAAAMGLRTTLQISFWHAAGVWHRFPAEFQGGCTSVGAITHRSTAESELPVTRPAVAQVSFGPDH